MARLDKGKGRTNVGAPRGSPLSLLIFLIYIAPILEDMEIMKTTIMVLFVTGRVH